MPKKFGFAFFDFNALFCKKNNISKSVLNNRGYKDWIYVLLLTITVIIASCSGETSVKKYYGGAFKFCSKNRLHSLHPSLVTDKSSEIIANQIFEGLVKLNPENLEVENCLAKEITFDPNTFTYSISLKENVYFHDNPCFENGKGRNLTANDVIYTFKHLCTKQLNNAAYHNTLKDVVKGVNDYYAGTSDDIAGVEKVDKYKIQISLYRPNGLFLKRLAGLNFAIIAKEAFEKYGENNNVGTGPFIPLKHDNYNDQFILVKNKNYYGMDEFQNQLPFLDSIIVDFELGLKDQIKNVVEHKASAVLNLPYKAVKRVINQERDKFDDELKMQNSPFFATTFIEFNLTKEPLKNKNLRKAINYALDKQEITYLVFGETRGKTGDAGLSHPFLPNYKKHGVNGYSLNKNRAKQLMNDSTIKINSLELDISSDDYKALSIADEIRFQIEKNLGIDLKINIVPERYLREKSMYARGDLSIKTVTAQFPSPDGFLNIFYGKTVPKSINTPSFPNTSRFKNKDFDRTLDRARRSIDEENANRSYAAAERLIMEEAPIAVLWYEESNRLIDAKLEAFPLNSIQKIDLSRVYYKKK